MKIRFTVFLACFGLAVAVPQPGTAQDWGSIRGPHFDGSASDAASELASGPLKLKVAWKKPLGSGYSGVVKQGDRLVTAMADVEADTEYVVALDARTGDTLWQTPTGKVFKGANGSFDGPVATPAVDATQAYHLSPYGNLAAYSLQDGSVVWSKNLTEDFQAQPNFYGFGASPIVYSGMLVVPVGSPEGAIMAFDVKSGDVVWKAGKDSAAFQSLVPVEVDGETALIAAGDTTLFAIEPTSGNVLWSQPHGGAEGFPAWAIVPVPVPDGGVFINDSREGSTVVDLSKQGGEERWSGREIRNTYCVPVAAGGVLCSYSSRFLVAVDPENGERLWRTRSPGNGFLATVADRLVVATMDGSVHIGDVDEDGFEEVAAADVFESGVSGSEGKLWALPAVAGKSVYLRSLGAIARVDIESGRSGAMVASAESGLGKGFAQFVESVAKSENKNATINEYLQGKETPIVEGDHIHFVLRGEYQDAAVACELFGVRQERTMTRIEGTDLFYFGTKLSEPTRASYVFFADYQPVVDPLNSKQAVSTTLAGEMEPSFMGPAPPLSMNWFDTTSTTYADAVDHPGTLRGKFERKTLDSTSMKSAVELAVYLPPGYAESGDQTYPVVFVHDGEVAITSGNQAGIVDSLIAEQKIRPTIVVFVKHRFYPMMGPAGYPEMFGKELIPMIMKSYRVSSDRNDRASLSGGFGATLGLMGTLPASQAIGRIGCHSPFAFEMLHPAVKQLASIPNDRCEILVQWGRHELRNPSENWNMALQAQAIAGMLNEGGHKVTASEVPTGSDWVCWRTQSEDMWTFLVGK